MVRRHPYDGTTRNYCHTHINYSRHLALALIQQPHCRASAESLQAGQSVSHSGHCPRTWSIFLIGMCVGTCVSYSRHSTAACCARLLCVASIVLLLISPALSLRAASGSIQMPSGWTSSAALSYDPSVNDPGSPPDLVSR